MLGTVREPAVTTATAGGDTPTAQTPSSALSARSPGPPGAPSWYPGLEYGVITNSSTSAMNSVAEPGAGAGAWERLAFSATELLKVLSLRRFPGAPLGASWERPGHRSPPRQQLIHRR